MKQINYKQIDIRLGAVIASLLLSAFTLLFPTTPNDDAYTYIRIAEIFLNEGLTAAYDYYSWASYGVLIGLVSKLGFEPFTAAFLLNALFYAVLVYAFVSIIREVAEHSTVVLWAAVVVLAYPQLNEYRYLVIRDVGFWALSLLAFWQYLRYARAASLRAAVCFCAALIAATLFRAEAIVYLVLTPLALLVDTRFPWAERRRRCLRLEGIIAGILLVSGLGLVLAGLNIVTLFLNFVSVYKPFLINTFSPPADQAAAIGAALFGDYAAAYSQEYIGVFMAAGLFTILLANLINGIGAPYLIVLLYGALRRKLTASREIVVPLLVYLSINAVVLLGFLIITRYLSSRYAMLFCLMLALLVPWIIHAGLRQHADKHRQLAISLVAVFFTYCVIDSFYSFGYSKAFVTDAVEWLAENDAEATSLLTNNHAIAYGSGKVVAYDKIERTLSEVTLRDWDGDGMIAIELSFAMRGTLERLESAGVIRRVMLFPNPDDADKGVAIYQRRRD